VTRRHSTIRQTHGRGNPDLVPDLKSDPSFDHALASRNAYRWNYRDLQGSAAAGYIRRTGGRERISGRYGAAGRLLLTTPSPYVRRHWLAQEIRGLRQEHKCSADELARAVGFPRQHLRLLENSQRGPDIDLVLGICDYFQVGQRRREALKAAAADGWTVGWWETDVDAIGIRQARFADLESGTETIWEYALGLVPGLLQTPQFADARARSDPARQPDNFDPAMSVRARARRQQLLLMPGGPRYELVLDELAVHRHAAEPPVVAAQLRHIVELCRVYPSISVTVLPINGATLKNHSAPQSAYTLFRYRDEQATLAVAVNTLSTDLVHIDQHNLHAYRELHSRLRAAALTPADSIALLNAAADHIDSTGETLWQLSSPTGVSLAVATRAATVSRSASQPTVP
jgi:DNA-binding XRE family transcriptional regulator